MGWECPACTFFNRHEIYLQCDCCGRERPSAEARRHPAPGQQQAPADPHTSIVEIDLLSSEDEEEAAEQQQQPQQQQQQAQEPKQQQPQRQQAQQPDQQQKQRSLGSMGAGGSKSSGGVAVARSPLGTSPRGWGEDTWDDDFQIQLSESLATTIRQLQHPGTASVHKQARWAEAEAAAEAAAAAAEAGMAAKAAAAEAGKQAQQALQQEQEQQIPAGGDARVDIDLMGDEWQEPLVQQPKKKKARRANEAAGAAVGQQQQQRAMQQPGRRQPAEQGSGSSEHTAVVDDEAAAAGAAAAAAGAAAKAAAAGPASKKPRLAPAGQAGAADAADEGQTAGWAMRALRVAARYASRQATHGRQQAAAQEPSLRQQQQQQQQPSDAPGRQDLALQSCRRASKRPWSATLRQLPSMHLSSLDAQQAQAGPLPVNPSLRLPPRRHLPGGTSPGTGSPGMSPPLGSSPESVQRLPDAAAAVQRQERQEQEEAAEEEEQQQQQQQGGSGGRVAWQQCVAALYDRAPLPAQQAQQAVQQMPLPPAAPVPAWVQRARQGPDVTQALVAAAADCPHVPLPDTWRQQRQQECEPAPVPGWLAYRVAGVLPEPAGCHHAADVLRVGTAAAAAAAAADAEAGSGAERQQAGAQPAGTGSQLQEQHLDLSQLAARLVAGLTMQEEPYADLEDRSLHLFSHRNSALHRKLKRHLAPLLGGSAAGGSRRPRIPGSRQPSRLRLPGTGDAAAGDAGEGAAAAAGAANEAAAAAAAAAQPFTGVRITAEGRFTACLYVRNEQLWLGSYAEVEAAARAVDLAMVYRWLCNGRPADRPAFNLPHNRYLEDADLLQELALMPGADGLKAHIKRVCGAAPPNWWQR